MRLASSIAFLLLWGLAALFLHTRWQEQQGQRLNEHTHVLQTTYHASISMYRLATETFIKQVVQRPEVIETFATGLAESHSARNVARGKLYRLLSHAFSDLK